MSSKRPSNAPRALTDSTSFRDSGSLDVDWLLHSKKDRVPPGGDKERRDTEKDNKALPSKQQSEPTPPQSPVEASKTVPPPGEITSAPKEEKLPAVTNGATNSTPTPPPKGTLSPANSPPSQSQTPPATRPTVTRGPSHEDGKNPAKGPVSNLKKEGGRRSSWISSLSSKFSSSTSPSPSRTASVDSSPAANTNSPQASPSVEFNNPFNKTPAAKEVKKEFKKEVKKESKKEEQKPVVVTHTPVRRPSVLVAAGKETKLEQPSFLSSAFRRLSSTNNASLGKGAGQGALCARRVMNIDQNRDRVKIKEFDQNKLKRVAFCVDVEIAGFAAQADEETPQDTIKPPVSAGQKQGLATSAPSAKKDTKDAKYKEKGEGAALKNPDGATVPNDKDPEVKSEPVAKAEGPSAVEPEKPQIEETVSAPDAQSKAEGQPAPTTRKKEKKKRSEAERKERRERKRRHAEANGLVPLEIVRDDSSSDSSPSSTPPGASSPKRNSDQPTTDPLRIYKRCCQLRETTPLSGVKDQISKPSAALAEASGTVSVIDLSGSQMQLADIVTLGDWLAVVPVRKLILDNCGLTDEAVRVILSGLSSCKSSEQAKQNRKLPNRISGKRGQEQMGVIEKLSLKNNTGITNLGWKHIALFLHMSRSLKAIDLAGIPFPRKEGDLSRTPTRTTISSTETDSNGNVSKPVDLSALVIRAISERFGDKLEELILSGCGLPAASISGIVDCATKCKIRRLGLANNALDHDGVAHVVRYLKSGACEGLDLGSNNLRNATSLIADAVDEDNPLFAISFSNCGLTPKDLDTILRPFTKLHSLKFIDLSRNHDLFKNETDAVPIFRKYLPKLTSLKRIHLSDVGLTPDHIIGIAEILPDCPSMCHLSILENERLIKAMNSKDDSSQEEACAYFASLMTAVRVSMTIVAIEIEVPSSESSEVVKALASQVVAYSLRNMERSALGDASDQSMTIPEKDAPEVLLHLVGHLEGYSENHDHDDPAPDQDYLIASTGIVKALSVFLGTKDSISRSHSRNISPAASGTATPKHGQPTNMGQKKPRNVSLELCESARKIRMRLRSALIKEDRAGNDDDYRRLFHLDQTLQRMIQRFEDEYPESKLPNLPSSPPATNGMAPLEKTQTDASIFSTSIKSNGSGEDYLSGQGEKNHDPHSLKLSRTSSNTSLAAKAFTNEEGRMHRFGQSIRREILKPTGTDDYAHGTKSTDEPELAHLVALRTRLEELKGEEIRQKVEKDGVDDVVRQLGINAQELMMLHNEDPESFAAFKNSQLAAQFNAGITNDGPHDMETGKA